MENRIVVTPRQVSLDSLREWVESKGGYWINDELQQGVIENEGGAVYISSYDDYLNELDDAERNTVEQRLMQNAVGAVTFTISRAHGSEDLADAIVESFCKDWSGVRADR